MKKLIDKIIKSMQFEERWNGKYDFDGEIIKIYSTGYDYEEEKSFGVGYFLNVNDGEEDIAIIEDELYDDDFDVLKVKVKQWYKDHLIEALEKAIELLKKE